jgi:methyl-accepting chemotaxis protein
VSPKPLNPKNLSDAFENQALMKFRAMSPDAEIYKFDFDKKILRYVKPMVTSQFCLKCHPNYELGSIEGGISITIPIEDIIQQIKQNRIYYASFFGITMAVLLVIMVYLMNVIVVKPIKKLTDQADKISTGEINVSAEIHRDDEIGELSKAIERLRISFKKMMNLK